MRQRQNVAHSPPPLPPPLPLPSPLADLQREGVSSVVSVAGAGIVIVIGRTKLCPLDRRGLATG